MGNNPSYSRTYLSKSNNHFQQPLAVTSDPEVLAKRRARNNLLKQGGQRFQGRIQSLHLPKVEPSPSTVLIATSTALNPAGVMDLTIDNEVYGPPVGSSDEEEEKENQDKTSTKAVQSLPTPENTQQSSKLKRRLPSSRPDANRRESKRLKGNKDEGITSVLDEEVANIPPPSSMELFPNSSQSSQRRRGQYHKGRRPQYRASPELSQNDTENADLNVPSSAEMPRRKRQGNVKFENLSSSQTSSPRSKTSKQEIDLPASSPTRKRRQRAFALPGVQTDEGPEMNGDDSDDIAQQLFASVEPARERRGSTSSLSSLNSINGIAVDLETEARLMADDDVTDLEETVSSIHFMCPRCKRTTLKEGIELPEPCTDTKNLTGLQQQQFCYIHRMRDARLAWNKAGYPELDFATLGTSKRVQKHIKNLLPVIVRKTPSFYLKKLDEAASRSKGQGAIKHFFAEETIDLIHHGYYGPRGAKVISKAIAEDTEVVSSLKGRTRDKAVQAAGVGRYIDCVLTPEVLIKLMQEDSKEPCNGEDARKVLKESQELGRLLCGDDDEVSAEEDVDLGNDL
ncbi:hypothetical protein LTS08_004947 [Lithohypha guttulata]|uniref:Restriction of telomere capping protein 4 n=1 Tax=Lithohypha guttulata TaxID=1690604 RepID=A0AAN7YHU3_9EURO|nr:hypothetical protein LTR05_002207 [Lithohypha guttulata]KAK5101340.1 hypothetical protein LTS08_004947 [Lithohypha guttulata]